jgi:SAM-dependent methyltransferase
MSQSRRDPPHEACPICGAQFSELRHGWLFRCGDCGLLASNLEPVIPTEAGPSVVDQDRSERGLQAVRARNNALILDAVLDVMGERQGTGRRLLDVGSGSGFFLKDAAARGFAITGIEPDGNFIDKARRSGVPVRHGFFPDCVAPEELYDVIVFNDVFEHIPDSGATIRACTQHLARGGLLVLNCPNREGFFYSVADLLDRLELHTLFDRLWQRGQPSPHVWYFSPNALSRLGRNYGLEPVKTLDLLPITLRGIRYRIFNVRGQSKLMSAVALLGTVIVSPILWLLPRDIGVVILRKN